MHEGKTEGTTTETQYWLFLTSAEGRQEDDNTGTGGKQTAGKGQTGREHELDCLQTAIDPAELGPAWNLDSSRQFLDQESPSFFPSAAATFVSAAPEHKLHKHLQPIQSQQLLPVTPVKVVPGAYDDATVLSTVPS